MERTIALAIAAAILYLPANLFPIMSSRGIGSNISNTIVGGVIYFWKMGSYPVAAIIFIASVVIPVLKLISITWLCIAVRTGKNPRTMTTLYRMTELIGRWSMVDVFVVAIMVAAVQFGSLMTVEPGAAALAFAGVVILTMLSAMSFDPRLIWDAARKKTTPTHKHP
ncbi:MAG TPA: paraquat-inducible protein A [Chthoniobacterales bacterium]